MGQHYTRATVSVTEWCKPCGKQTTHRVDGTRLGPCLECMAKLEGKPKEEPKAQQKGLFDK